jgi:hypothetical protein
MATLQPEDSTDRSAALDEVACRLEAAARMLAYVLIFDDFVDLETAASAAIRLIERAQHFVRLAAA